MKVRALIDFRDRENGSSLRKKGVVFDADEKRAEKLLNFGYVETVGKDGASRKDGKDDQI